MKVQGYKNRTATHQTGTRHTCNNQHSAPPPATTESKVDAHKLLRTRELPVSGGARMPESQITPCETKPDIRPFSGPCNTISLCKSLALAGRHSPAAGPPHKEYVFMQQHASRRGDAGCRVRRGGVPMGTGYSTHSWETQYVSSKPDGYGGSPVVHTSSILCHIQKNVRFQQAKPAPCAHSFLIVPSI